MCCDVQPIQLIRFPTPRPHRRNSRLIWGKNIGDSIPLNKEPVEKFAQVRCTRMYQSPNATRQSSSISIITWENDTWPCMVKVNGIITNDKVLNVGRLPQDRWFFT